MIITGQRSKHLISISFLILITIAQYCESTCQCAALIRNRCKIRRFGLPYGNFFNCHSGLYNLSPLQLYKDQREVTATAYGDTDNNRYLETLNICGYNMEKDQVTVERIKDGINRPISIERQTFEIPKQPNRNKCHHIKFNHHQGAWQFQNCYWFNLYHNGCFLYDTNIEYATVYTPTATELYKEQDFSIYITKLSEKDGIARIRWHKTKNLNKEVKEFTCTIRN